MSKADILVVCAHPDDESLGCGGTIAKHVSKGDHVRCLVMANNYRSPRIYDDLDAAMRVLGVIDCKTLDLPDSTLERYTRMELAQMVEEYVQSVGVPDIVYTHSPDELSQDHRIVFWTVLTVFRPVWDKRPSIYSFESPSSAEWSSHAFDPNMFVDIGNHIEQKIQACACYATEFREPPHPRSAELLKSRAVYWGSCCGVRYAEAFRLVREVR